jgi:hypothetical protein
MYLPECGGVIGMPVCQDNIRNNDSQLLYPANYVISLITWIDYKAFFACLRGIDIAIGLIIPYRQHFQYHNRHSIIREA